MTEWWSVGEEVKGSGERKERRDRGKEGTEEAELSSSSANFQ